jgi:OPA family glycerol-3-phosphate transporter-like MFS transporter
MEGIPPLREPTAEEQSRLMRWRRSTFWAMLLGYVGYYACRANLYAALPLLSQDFGYTNSQLGLIALYPEVVYSLGKFVNGPLGDRIGGKNIFMLGMVGAVACNVLFALSGSLVAFVTIWCVCRFFLSMGWGGVVKTIASWYEAERNGTIMGFVSLTFQFGGVAVSLLAGALVARGVGWRGLFLYPAALLAAILVWSALAAKDGPIDVVPGVRFGRTASLKPSIAGFDEQFGSSRSVDVVGALLRLAIFRHILVFSLIANFLRSIFLFWIPKLLVDIGMENANAILSSAAFPLLGGVGTVLLGWYTDSYAAKGDRARMMGIMLCGLTASLLLIGVLLPHGRLHQSSIVALIGLAGLFLLGPYSMSAGALTLDIAGPRGAATCAGFIDGVGYFGGAFSTWMAGRMADQLGWSQVFLVLAGSASLATVSAFMISRAYRRGLQA